MKLEKAAGIFLSKDDVSTGDIITFRNEGEVRDKEFQGKKKTVFNIGVTLEDGSEKLVTLNNTSRNLLIQHYGEETKAWVGKPGRIEIVLQNVQGEFKDVLYVTPPTVNIKGELITG